MHRILIPLSKRSVRRALEIAESSGRVDGFGMASVRGSWYTTQQSGEGEFAMKAALLAAVFAAAALASLASATTPAPTKVVGNVKVGRSLFIAHDCGSCHLLAAANAMSPSGIGADLDTSKKTYAQMITQITNGGHGMTGYKHVLTVAQIQDLAAFVYKSSHP
jgi:mono/diheme cytochrome c family protein